MKVVLMVVFFKLTSNQSRASSVYKAIESAVSDTQRSTQTSSDVERFIQMHQYEMERIETDLGWVRAGQLV